MAAAPRSLNPRISTPEVLALCEDVWASCYGALPLYFAEVPAHDLPAALRPYHRRMRDPDADLLEVWTDLELRLVEFCDVLERRNETQAPDAAEELRGLLGAWHLGHLDASMAGLFDALALTLAAAVASTPADDRGETFTPLDYDLRFEGPTVLRIEGPPGACADLYLGYLRLAGDLEQTREDQVRLGLAQAKSVELAGDILRLTLR